MSLKLEGRKTRIGLQLINMSIKSKGKATDICMCTHQQHPAKISSSVVTQTFN